MSIGTLFRAARLKRSATLEATAAAVGVNYTTLARIESGKIDQPRAGVLFDLADELGVPYEEVRAATRKASPTTS